MTTKFFYSIPETLNKNQEKVTELQKFHEEQLPTKNSDFLITDYTSKEASNNYLKKNDFKYKNFLARDFTEEYSKNETNLNNSDKEHYQQMVPNKMLMANSY